MEANQPEKAGIESPPRDLLISRKVGLQVLFRFLGSPPLSAPPSASPSSPHVGPVFLSSASSRQVDRGSTFGITMRFVAQPLWISRLQDYRLRCCCASMQLRLAPCMHWGPPRKMDIYDRGCLRSPVVSNNYLFLRC